MSAFEKAMRAYLGKYWREGKDPTDAAIRTAATLMWTAALTRAAEIVREKGGMDSTECWIARAIESERDGAAPSGEKGAG